MAGAMILLTRLGFERGPGAEAQARAIASSFFCLTDVTVWAPLCEELWFRALLYTSLRTRLGVAASAVVTAALFACGPLSRVPRVGGRLLFPCGVEFPLVRAHAESVAERNRAFFAQRCCRAWSS